MKKLDPKPAAKVKTIVTHEGKFLSLAEMKERLKDDRVIDQALAMLKVGVEQKQDPHHTMRVALGSFLVACAGEGGDSFEDAASGSGKVEARTPHPDFWVPSVIKSDGTVFAIKPRNGTDFGAQELNAIVNGHFELIPLERQRYMVLNEDGKGIGLPVNDKATAILHNESQAQADDYVVGDVLICFQNQIK